MKKDVISEYLEYSKKIGNRKELYKIVFTKYKIKKLLYPGSHIDIAPSLVVPNVTYIDNFKGTINFFKNIEIIKNYIYENKEYKEDSNIIFLAKDYREKLNIKKVDLIISQYAAFAAQSTKKYLKKDGILLCNDSHGDATIAKFDDEFKLIGVIKNNKIIFDNLNEYFVLPHSKKIDLLIVKSQIKGPKYKINAENYLFLKI